jgi:hypothetical protein
MTRTRRKSAVLAAVAGAAILAIGIGAATGAKLKTGSASTTIGPDSQASATAVCEPGTNVLSGGFELIPGDASAVSPIASTHKTLEGRPYHHPIPRKWKAAGINLGDAPAAVRSYAYCRDWRINLPRSAAEPTSFSTGGTPTPVPDEEEEVRIPLGCTDAVIAGSFEARRGTSAFVRASYRGKRKWRWIVIARATGADDAQLRAFTICEDGKALKKRTKTETASGGDPVDAVARCKRGERVVSGGFQTEHFPGDGGPFVYASRKQGKRGWLVRVLATEPEEFTSHAYCEKKVRSARR